MGTQKRAGLEQVPDAYQVRHIVTDGSGNITVDGVAYTEDGSLVYNMKVYDKVLLIDCNGSDALVVNLPSVVEAEGTGPFLVRFIDFGAAELHDKDDSREWSDLDPDADGEYAFVEAIGGQWVVLATDIS